MAEVRFPEWKRIEGGDLVDPANLKLWVPSDPGIYMWKRNFNSPPECRIDEESFTNWCERVLSYTYGISETSKLNHFLKNAQFELGGSGLTPEKRKRMLSYADSKAKRKWLSNYFLSLEKFAPSLYVGKAINLSKRIPEHLNAETDFGQRIVSSELDWIDLSLYFFVPDNSNVPEEFLTTIEYLATISSLAGLTQRAG